MSKSILRSPTFDKHQVNNHHTSKKQLPITSSNRDPQILANFLTAISMRENISNHFM